MANLTIKNLVSSINALNLLNNDVEKGIYNMIGKPQEKTYKRDGKDNTFFIYNFKNSKGNILKFTSFDLQSFFVSKTDIVSKYISDNVTKAETTKVSLINKFEVTNSDEATNQAGEKIYPIFMREGYADYKAKLEETDENDVLVYTKEELQRDLYLTEISDRYTDNYKRNVIVKATFLN